MVTPKNIIDSIKYLCRKWQLSNLRTVEHISLTNNYIAIAYSKKYKTDVVLKILVAKTNELEALKLFDGNGCVKLLDYDLEHNALLLEYIKPGISLKTLFPENDCKAIEVTAEVIKKLQSKNLINKAEDFKTINQWLDLLNRFQSQKIPKDLLQKAKQLSEKLLNKKPKLYLLHGDLHHENILKSSDRFEGDKKYEEWVAIDPKGVIGPLEYEVGRFIMNPLPDLLEQSNAKDIIKKRIDEFTKIFGFEKQCLIDWVFVQAILSACWSEQDGDDTLVNYFVKFAQII